MADVNTKDLKYLYPALIPPVLDGRIVSLALTAAGTLGDIGKAGLDISSPGHVAFTADGAARTCSTPAAWRLPHGSKAISGIWRSSKRCCPTPPCGGA